MFSLFNRITFGIDFVMFRFKCFRFPGNTEARLRIWVVVVLWEPLANFDGCSRLINGSGRCEVRCGLPVCINEVGIEAELMSSEFAYRLCCNAAAECVVCRGGCFRLGITGGGWFNKLVTAPATAMAAFITIFGGGIDISTDGWVVEGKLLGGKALRLGGGAFSWGGGALKFVVGNEDGGGWDSVAEEGLWSDTAEWGVDIKLLRLLRDFDDESIGSFKLLSVERVLLLVIVVADGGGNEKLIGGGGAVNWLSPQLLAAAIGRPPLEIDVEMFGGGTEVFAIVID